MDTALCLSFFDTNMINVYQKRIDCIELINCKKLWTSYFSFKYEYIL